MRSINLVSSVLFASLAVAVVQVGCSSDNTSSGPNLTPYDSGVVAVPPAPAAPGPVTIAVTGQGSVQSTDVLPNEAGVPAGMVTCSGAGGKCTASQGSTLYVVPAQGWAFQGWTGPGGALISTGDSIQINPGTPGTVTAVFVAVGTGTGPQDAGGGG